MGIPTGIPIGLIPAIMAMNQSKSMTNAYPHKTLKPKQISENQKLQERPVKDGENGTDGKSPFIGTNGNWYEFSSVFNAYVDTGIKASPDPIKISKAYIEVEKNISTEPNDIINIKSVRHAIGDDFASLSNSVISLPKGKYTIELQVENAAKNQECNIELCVNGSNVYRFKGVEHIVREYFISSNSSADVVLANRGDRAISLMDSQNSRYNIIITKYE